ncbi:MAG: putative ATPase [Gammaproteobacteria bacterium]|jgi:hypothetical protein|nr:putative ATPase [Gammaproteobacteria bacterium]
MPTDRIIRVGGASGYWGDTASGPRQLADIGRLDFMAFDYLAESTMGVLAKARTRDPGKGYATDFIDFAMRPLLPRLMADKVRIIANAGGVNLVAAREALAAVAQELGVEARIAIVGGDDLLAKADRYRSVLRPFGSQTSLPDKLASLNAYLGAFPIARALNSGAEIVLTGRCVDSALILGPLIHAFGWTERDYNLLAQGSLCGHLLECGAQVTGGNFTDWRDTVDDWANMGFPIAEVAANGTFVITKAEGTGGKVSRLSVAEQLVYEIGDPGAYLLPDVTCDFTAVTLTETGADRVAVAGARGAPPTPTVKVTATTFDGFSCRGTSVIVGFDSRAKAKHMAHAILAKAEASLQGAGLPPFAETRIDLISGTEKPEQENPRAWGSSIFRIAVRHGSPTGAELFARELMGAGLSMSPGITPLAPGRPSVSPLIRIASFLLDKTELSATVRVGDDPPQSVPFSGPYRTVSQQRSSVTVTEQAFEGNEVSLIDLAVARSGDKGNDANVGVIARDPALLPLIRSQLGLERILALFESLGPHSAERYELPGIGALNFVLRDTLGGGGAGSLLLDPLAKTFAQRVLSLSIRVPLEIPMHRKNTDP